MSKTDQAARDLADLAQRAMTEPNPSPAREELARRGYNMSSMGGPYAALKDAIGAMSPREQRADYRRADFELRRACQGRTSILS